MKRRVLTPWAFVWRGQLNKHVRPSRFAVVFHIWYHRELISQRDTWSVFRPLYRVYIQGSFYKVLLCYKHIDLSCSMVYEKCHGQLTPMRTLDRFNFSECSHFFVFICAQIIASSWHVWDSTSSVQALFMFIVYCQEDLMTLMQRQTVIRFTVGRALDSTLNVAGVRWDQIAGAAFGAAPVNVNEPLTALKGQLWSVQVVLTKVPNAVTRSLTSCSVAYPVLSRICKIRST